MPANFKRITLDGDHLNNALTTTQTLTTSLDDITGKLLQAQSQIAQDWTGADGAAFANHFGTIHGQVTKLQNAVQAVHAAIDQAVQAVDQAESVLTQRANDAANAAG